MNPWKRIGFWLGLMAMGIAWVLSFQVGPDSEWSPGAIRVAGVTLWMALWWVTEAVGGAGVGRV